MAGENIDILYPNFCRGPVNGTICTLDTSSAKTFLKVKNLTGTHILDLSLASNIITDNPRVEYVGPYGLPAMIDGLTFFTFEKVSTTTCMIKRWSTRVNFRELILEEQIVKSNTGYERYNAIDFAVEYYHRTIQQPVEYYNYIYLNSASNIKTGTKLLLGPSSDTDNPGAIEVAVVSHISNWIDGQRVYLTSPTNYQYVVGDQVTFYSYVYIASKDGYAGQNDIGTIYKLDVNTWNTVNVDNSAIYKQIRSTRWCPYVAAVAFVINTNMLFVQPYDSYSIWRSMFLSNIEDDDNTQFTVYDVMFDDYGVYKLQKKYTIRTDVGTKVTINWNTYNYQADTLLPYTNSVVTYADQNIVTGHRKTVNFEAQVRDQYHVSLRDVILNFYFVGDSEGYFAPLDGIVTTDTDGKATMNYISGTTYIGSTAISTRANGSSTSHGSEYVWTTNHVLSSPTSETFDILAWQRLELSGDLCNLIQIRNAYKIIDEQQMWVDLYVRLYGKSCFTSPGGHWKSSLIEGGMDPGRWKLWLPFFNSTNREDGPDMFGGGNDGPFSIWDEDRSHWNESVPNRITLLLDTEASIKTTALVDYLVYEDGSPPRSPHCTITSPDESGELQFSQLHLSLHTYWSDGIAYDTAWTHVEIDQFIFVEDANPKFYSEKNARETDIWLRLRPFAFSLNSTTVRMWVREISFLGDSGYVEVTSQLGIINFDAGSGLLGLEVTYNPTRDFYNGSNVYVLIEVYDEAYIPNFISVEYWFKVIPDYKSPYLINTLPDSEDINVDVNTTIYFEIKDDGSGVDIDSFEGFLNSRRMFPEFIGIEKVSLNHYKITYTPPEPLMHDKDYKVNVKVRDLSEQNNILNDSYRFYTRSSSGLVIQDMDPKPCERGLPRYQSVRATLLADGDGIDMESIRMQILNKDINPYKIPIVYRVS